MKPLLRGEVYYGVIVLLRGAEAGGELGDGEEVPVGGTGGVVEGAEKFVEACRIAQGKNDVQIHDLVGRELTDALRLTVPNGFSHVTRHHGLGL